MSTFNTLFKKHKREVTDPESLTDTEALGVVESMGFTYYVEDMEFEHDDTEKRFDARELSTNLHSLLLVVLQWLEETQGMPFWVDRWTGKYDRHGKAILAGHHIAFKHENPEKAYGGLVVQAAAEEFYLDVPEFPSYLPLDILPTSEFEIVPAPGEKTWKP